VKFIQAFSQRGNVTHDKSRKWIPRNSQTDL